jgi:hypothetical protein
VSYREEAGTPEGRRLPDRSACVSKDSVGTAFRLVRAPEARVADDVSRQDCCEPPLEALRHVGRSPGSGRDSAIRRAGWLSKPPCPNWVVSQHTGPIRGASVLTSLADVGWHNRHVGFLPIAEKLVLFLKTIRRVIGKILCSAACEADVGPRSVAAREAGIFRVAFLNAII